MILTSWYWAEVQKYWRSPFKICVIETGKCAQCCWSVFRVTVFVETKSTYPSVRSMNTEKKTHEPELRLMSSSSLTHCCIVALTDRPAGTIPFSWSSHSSMRHLNYYTLASTLIHWYSSALPLHSLALHCCLLLVQTPVYFSVACSPRPASSVKL